MSLAQEDPNAGLQKSKKKSLIVRSLNKLQAFLAKVLVNRQALMFAFNLVSAIYKLIKFLGEHLF